MTINHMTSLVKAPKAAANVRVLVTTATVNPRNAHAPTGRGDNTRPAMVVKKMANNCHACVVTDAGFATRYRRARPKPTETTKGKGFTPAQGTAPRPFPLLSSPIAATEAALALIGGKFTILRPLEIHGEARSGKLLELSLTTEGKRAEERELEREQLEKASGHDSWLLGR
jgi:hypothetical protein